MGGSGTVGRGSDPVNIPKADQVRGATKTPSEGPAKRTALVDVAQLPPMLGTKAGDPTLANAALRPDSSGPTRGSTVEAATAANRMVTRWDALPLPLQRFFSMIDPKSADATRLAELAKAVDKCTASESWPNGEDFLISAG